MSCLPSLPSTPFRLSFALAMGLNQLFGHIPRKSPLLDSTDYFHETLSFPPWYANRLFSSNPASPKKSFAIEIARVVLLSPSPKYAVTSVLQHPGNMSKHIYMERYRVD